jgi:hypothetical protein
MNNAPCKVFKKMLLGQRNWKINKKFQLIWTYENMVKIEPFKKSITIKWFKVFKENIPHMNLSFCITLYIKVW